MSSEDVLEITRVLNLYCFAVDSQQWSLFDRVFTPDLKADYFEAGHWTDRASFKRDLELYHDRYKTTQHAVSSHNVEVQFGKAFAITYGHWRLIQDLPQGEGMWEATGWYDDELIRLPEGWRIRARKVRALWSRAVPEGCAEALGVTYTLTPASLRSEGAAGRVGLLNALNKEA
jgi:hypothetical protein